MRELGARSPQGCPQVLVEKVCDAVTQALFLSSPPRLELPGQLWVSRTSPLSTLLFLFT